MVGTKKTLGPEKSEKGKAAGATEEGLRTIDTNQRPVPDGGHGCMSTTAQQRRSRGTAEASPGSWTNDETNASAAGQIIAGRVENDPDDRRHCTFDVRWRRHGRGRVTTWSSTTRAAVGVAVPAGV